MNYRFEKSSNFLFYSFDDHQEAIAFNLFNYYALCEDYYNPLIGKLIMNYCSCYQIEIDNQQINLMASKPSNEIMRRKKSLKIHEHDFLSKANELLYQLKAKKDDLEILIKRKQNVKPIVGQINGKGSKYMNVIKNGKNYQALIKIDKRKYYVGSFKLENHAAIVSDFFSILLYSFNARTNFDYTRDCIEQMIWNYKQNGNELRPEELNFM